MLQVFKAAQPALLYLVPFTLFPLLTMAWLKVLYFKAMHQLSTYMSSLLVFNRVYRLKIQSVMLVFSTTLVN